MSKFATFIKATSIAWSVSLLHGQYNDVIVFGTDGGYVLPTAVAIQSLKESTPEEKTVVVLYPKEIKDSVSEEVTQRGLSSNDIKCFRQLSDATTRVIPVEIPQSYMEKAKRIANRWWSSLVQVRIYYRDMFRDPEILAQIGLQGVRYLIHLDGGLWVIRNIFDLVREMEASGRDWCIASSTLDKIYDGTEKLEEGEKKISGGVIIFNLAHPAPSPDDIVKRYFYEEKILTCLWDNDYGILILKLLVESPELRGIFSNLTLASLKQELHGGNGAETKLIQALHKLSEYFPSIFADEKIFSDLKRQIKLALENTEDCDHIKVLNVSKNILKEGRKPARDATEQNITKPTEEDIFSAFQPIYWFSSRYNFNPRYLFPELNESRTYLTDRCWHPWEILQEEKGGKNVYAQRREILRTPHVIHFDGCTKPWSQTNIILAQPNPELYKITYIHWRYLKQIVNQSIPFTGIDAEVARLGGYLSGWEALASLDKQKVPEIFENICLEQIIARAGATAMGTERVLYKIAILYHCKKCLETALETQIEKDDVQEFLDDRALMQSSKRICVTVSVDGMLTEGIDECTLLDFDRVLELSPEALAKEFIAWLYSGDIPDEAAVPESQ